MDTISIAMMWDGAAQNSSTGVRRTKEQELAFYLGCWYILTTLRDQVSKLSPDQRGSVVASLLTEAGGFAMTAAGKSS
jgi:hypothetical protein